MIFVVHGVIGSTTEKLSRLTIPPGLFQLRNVVNALRRAQKLDHTLDAGSIAIIAPSFQRNLTWQPYTDEDQRNWTWKGSTWNTGTLAVANETFTGIVRAEPVSSFDVFDEFMRAALIKFPNLEHLIIVGHSAGGQAVHRYALLGVGVHERLESEGIHVRYMPAVGKRIVKAAPRSRPSLATSSVPPWSSVSCLAMESPKPMPPWLRVIEASAWRKRSNT
jgi:hypothetical protein